MITLDTSAIFALLNRRDPAHEKVKACLLADRGPYLVPAGILGEVGYLVEKRLGTKVLAAFLTDLQNRGFSLDCGEERIARVKDLVERYADLPLGFSDASVIACAEAYGKTVMTLDRRDFDVVAREFPLKLLP